MAPEHGNVDYFHRPRARAALRTPQCLSRTKLAPPLLSHPVTMHTAESKSHMSCVRLYDHGPAGIRLTAPLTISATLWRIMPERFEWVFAFSGEADVFVVDAILEHVSRLTGHAPEEWGFELVASGPRPDVLREIEHRFHDLVRSGVRQRLAGAAFALPNMRLALAKSPAAGVSDGSRVLH